MRYSPEGTAIVGAGDLVESHIAVGKNCFESGRLVGDAIDAVPPLQTIFSCLQKPFALVVRYALIEQEHIFSRHVFNSAPHFLAFGDGVQALSYHIGVIR